MAVLIIYQFERVEYVEHDKYFSFSISVKFLFLFKNEVFRVKTETIPKPLLWSFCVREKPDMYTDVRAEAALTP